jgi:hypothetical protein
MGSISGRRHCITLLDTSEISNTQSFSHNKTKLLSPKFLGLDSLVSSAEVFLMKTRKREKFPHESNETKTEAITIISKNKSTESYKSKTREAPDVHSNHPLISREREREKA